MKNKMFVTYAKKITTDDDDGDKKYHKVGDHCHFTGKYSGAAHNICNLKYKTPKEIPIVFHNGSTYDYQFFIKKLAKEFDEQFECLGGNTENYVNFSVPAERELYNGKAIKYKINFVGRFSFMLSSLSNLLDN